MSDTKVVSLKTGILFQGARLKTLTLRAPNLGDMMDAEADASAANPVSYRTALLARVIDRADDFTGPFTVKMLRSMAPGDYNLLAVELSAFDDAGEDVPGGKKDC